MDGCFHDLLSTRVGPVLLHELADPDRLHRLGVTGLQAFVARRGVRLQTAKAQVLHQAAADALRLPAAERACRAAVLTADLEVLDLLNAQVTQAEQHLAAVLPDTPAGVLLSLPGVGVVRASNYGAAVGDPARFGNADQAYRASGLVPATYASAGLARRGQGISARATPACGRRSSSSVAGSRSVIPTPPATAGVAGRMKPLQAAIAVGHRAHRLAFALIRNGELYDPARLAESVATGGHRRRSNRDKRRAGPSTDDRGAACRHDVTHPPTPTLPQLTRTRKTPVRT